MSRERNISASDVENWLVTAIESCTDYQGPQDEGTRLLWMLLDYVQKVGAAREAAQPDPEIPVDYWGDRLDAARNEGMSAPEIDECVRNDIIRREVEIRLREELARIRREGGGA